MACTPFFYSARAIRKHVDDGAVETDGLDAGPHELLTLQLREQAIQHAGLRPAVDAGVDRVPVAEAFGQRPPLAAVFRNVQDRVDDIEVADRDVAALYRQDRLNALELLGGNFHASSISRSVNRPYCGR